MKQILNVTDVHWFNGHIACSHLTQSEIVLPLFDNAKNVIAVLDMDSVNREEFDAIDETSLKSIVELIR